MARKADCIAGFLQAKSRLKQKRPPGHDGSSNKNLFTKCDKKGCDWGLRSIRSKFSSCALLTLASIANWGMVQAALPESWEARLPQEQSVCPDKLLEVIAEIQCQERFGGIQSVLVLRNGYLIMEKYFRKTQRDNAVNIFSVTKNVTSSLIGALIQEGKISSVHDPIVKYMPYLKINSSSECLEKLSLHHLLSMSTGLPWDERRFDLMENRLNTVEEIFKSNSYISSPGESFNYDEASYHLLSLLIEKVSKKKASEYAREVMFDPLGISAPVWWSDGNFHTIGGYGLSLTPRDLIKIGFLYLNMGKWGKHQILSEEFVQKAIQSKNDGGFPAYCSYGYSWWISPEKDYYFGLGLGGQFLVVVPALEMVIVITADGKLSFDGLTDSKELVEKFILSSTE